MPREFVFSSGRRCKTYDEFVQGCHQEWGDARDLLRRGSFGQFFAGAGRLDLAKAAKEAQAQSPDPDIALHAFIGRLPVSQAQQPRLDLKPRRLLLGALKAGDSRKVQLTVANQGRGVLQGTLKVTEGSKWLHVDDGSGNGQCMLNVPREQAIKLRVDTVGLAAPQTYSAKLTVITNGGIVEVPVRLDLTSHPFPKAPYQGASTPRQIAERMRSNPKPAVVMLESGEVESWFRKNGWTYPTQGATAKGVAAVQQFFEGMGLSKPPLVQLTETEARYSCRYPEVIRGQVTIRTAAKKWVYANVDSDAPWLRILTPGISGPQQAVIQYEVDSSQMEGSGLQEGVVKVVANAGQKLNLRVRVDARRPQESIVGRMVHPIVVGAMLGLFYRVFLTVFADIWARLLMAPTGWMHQTFGKLLPMLFKAPKEADKIAALGSTPGWWAEPLMKVPDPMAAFSDPAFVLHFVVATWWIGTIAGVVLVWRRGGRSFDVIYGAVAGTFAGILVAGTVACLMPVLDPDLAILPLDVRTRPRALALALYLFLDRLDDSLLDGDGGLAGFLLGLAGKHGRQLLGYAGRPVGWVLGCFGLKRAAAYLAMQ